MSVSTEDIKNLREATGAGILDCRTALTETNNDFEKAVDFLREKGLAILITDHAVRATLAIVDRAYLLYDGKVLREGKSSFLIEDEMSRKLYLGDEFKM